MVTNIYKDLDKIKLLCDIHHDEVLKEYTKIKYNIKPKLVEKDNILGISEHPTIDFILNSVLYN